MAKRYRATKFFAKLATLNAIIDSGSPEERQAANKAKRKVPDTWTKRQSNNAGSFWKAKNAKPS